jgi:O-antigen ligase
LPLTRRALRLTLSPLLLALTILVGGSALHTIYPDRTIQSLLLLLAYLLGGLVAAQAAREVPWAKRVLLAAVAASGVLAGGYGLGQILWTPPGEFYAGVLIGPFGYPNAMAGFLLLAGGAAVAAARGARGSLGRITPGAAAALAAAGLLLTRSRGALLAAGVGVIVWMLLEFRTWGTWRRRAVWGGGLGAVFALLWIARSRAGSLFGPEGLRDPLADPSVSWRWHILRWTWDMVRDHPIWGVGPGAFPVALTHYQQIPYVSGENPHNLFLELAAEYGLPAGVLALLVLGIFLGRAALAIKQAPTDHPLSPRRPILLATLVAFLAHSLVDLDWSFPAIALAAATMFGLAAPTASSHQETGTQTAWFWRAILVAGLGCATLLALSRSYDSNLVASARSAMAAGDTASAKADLAWALRFNPLSFPAHYWMAWAQLRSRDHAAALDMADRTVRLAPSDPNTHYLAGEIAAAGGQWEQAEERFRAAVERAPSTQLRFHASLVEALSQAGKEVDSRIRYEQAAAIFTPSRVLGSEARCLAPGDRYLLARMSRVAARLYADAGDRTRHDALAEHALTLAQPDSRGICGTGGPPGQTSPERTIQSFWRALAEDGWPEAGRFLLAGNRTPGPGSTLGWWPSNEYPRAVRVAWVAALHGGESRARLRYELEIDVGVGPRRNQCAQTDLTRRGPAWYLEGFPTMEPLSCESSEVTKSVNQGQKVSRLQGDQG